MLWPKPRRIQRGPVKRLLQRLANRRAAEARVAHDKQFKAFKQSDPDYQRVRWLNGYMAAERRDLRKRLRQLRAESRDLKRQMRVLRKQRPRTPAVAEALARAQGLLDQKTQRIKEDPVDLENGLAGLRQQFSGSLEQARKKLAQLTDARRALRSGGFTGWLRIFSRKKGSPKRRGPLRRRRAMLRSGGLKRLSEDANKKLAKKWGLG